MIAGTGSARAGGETFPLAGESVLWLAACPGLEFWAPPPAETIWTVAEDSCTWAPAG